MFPSYRNKSVDLLCKSSSRTHQVHQVHQVQLKLTFNKINQIQIPKAGKSDQVLTDFSPVSHFYTP